MIVYNASSCAVLGSVKILGGRLPGCVCEVSAVVGEAMAMRSGRKDGRSFELLPMVNGIGNMISVVGLIYVFTIRVRV